MQRDLTGLRQGITADDAGAGIQRDARQCQNVSCELCGRAERRGGANLKKHIAALSAVDQINARIAGSGQIAPDFDDED